MKKSLFVIIIGFLIIPFTVFGKGDLASTYISNLNDSNLINDGTPDNNKRYIGSNPNNYVLFNNEKSSVVHTIYGISANNIMLDSYDDESTCNNAVNSFIGHVFNHGAQYSCVLNEDTSKYEMFATGTISDEAIGNLGGYDVNSLDACNAFRTNNFPADSTSCVGKDQLFKGWRIVGVFNNNGKKLVKIVRNESVGSYSFDGTPNTINGGMGKNAWNESAMMKLLNAGYDNEIADGSLYWNSGSGICFKANGASGIDCDFTDKGLTDAGKSMITDALWNTSFVDNNANGLELYNKERSGNTVIDIPQDYPSTDGATRSATWTGKVGLLSASDLALASTNCSENLIENGINSCANNWLFDTDKPILTMTPSRNYLSKILVSDSVNTFSVRDASDSGEIYPSVFLADDVYIVGGDGTITNPYTLAKGKKEFNINITQDSVDHALASYVSEIDPAAVNWDISDNSVISLNNGVFKTLKVGRTTLDASVNGVFYVINITVNGIQQRVNDSVSTSNTNYTKSNFSDKLTNPKTNAYLNKVAQTRSDLNTDIATFIMFLIVSALTVAATFRKREN